MTTGSTHRAWLRDGVDGPHILELCFYKTPSSPSPLAADSRL